MEGGGGGGVWGKGWGNRTCLFHYDIISKHALLTSVQHRDIHGDMIQVL